MKENTKNKGKKEDIILFLCIFIFVIIANSAFLQRHYSSDAMCLIDLGYFEYPLNFFLLDGRVVSGAVCFLGGILNLPIDIYLFISGFIGMILLSVSIIVLFKFTINYLEIKNKWIKSMILLSVYTIIVNHMSIEYLLYPESCVMCAGLLFSITAVTKYLNGKKGNWVDSFAFLMLSVLCYQGLINIFPTLVITFSFLKMRKNKKETLKFYIKEILKLGTMFVLVMLISAALIFIFNNILQNSTYRLERIEDALNLIAELPTYFVKIFLGQTEKIPMYLSVIVMAIVSIIIIVSKNNSLFLNYLLSSVTAYLFGVLPIAVWGYALSRTLMAVGAMMGISLLYITSTLNDKKEKIPTRRTKTVLISICVIFYFIFNVINNGVNSYEHLKAFRIDEEVGKKISKLVNDYEESSGKEITKFSYCYDIEVQVYESEIKNLGALTERKFAVPIKESLNYYCNKKLQYVIFPDELYYNNFDGKNYTEFSEEQIIFVEDTLYMCVY